MISQRCWPALLCGFSLRLCVFACGVFHRTDHRRPPHAKTQRRKENRKEEAGGCGLAPQVFMLYSKHLPEASMYCPSCGASQSEEKKFCTNCGTNLLAVSRALQGPPAAFTPTPALQSPMDRAREAEREQRYASGLRFTIFGAAFLAFQLLRFIFSWHLNEGSPFGFFSIVAVVLVSIGISRIATSRTHQFIPQRQVTPLVTPPPQAQETTMIEAPPSVTEETTRHFQQERTVRS